MFYPIAPISGQPYDDGRNAGVMMGLQSGAEWIMSLDSDVIPPHDTIFRLLRHNKPIVSGMYCRRSPPHGVPVAIKNGAWVTNFVVGDLVEVDLVGAGCLLVHRSVYENVPPQRPGKPWYDWRVSLKGTGIVPEETCLSEDFCWNYHVRQHGYKIYLDTSIQCRHVGFSMATLGNMLPLETAAIT